MGRFAVGDYFDGNSYAKDPRLDFMNWAMWASAAYDFPADLPGFTRGAVVEFNRRDWAVRAGVFQVPAAPNSDVLTFQTGGAVVGLEERYTILDQPGKLRLGAFANRGKTGNFQETLAAVAVGPTLDINATMVSLRRDRLNTDSILTRSSRLQRMLVSSHALAGPTARTKFFRLRTSIAACRAASPSKAAIGDERMTPSGCGAVIGLT